MSMKSLFWGTLALVVLAGLFVVLFGSVVDFAFHVLEYVALALAAGWVGYKVGHARGRKGH
jgi:hypothetical protein